MKNFLLFAQITALLGFNFILWGIIGLIRLAKERFDGYMSEKAGKKHGPAPAFWSAIFRNKNRAEKFPNLAPRNEPVKKRARQAEDIEPGDVAAIIPAHNEELTIAETVASLKKIMPASNIYVGSDASVDRTVEIIHDLNCHVLDSRSNIGKANILTLLINNLDLIKHYGAVMIVDADSEVYPDYLDKALPLFRDPEVAAVAVHAESKWKKHILPRPSMLYTAYRTRLYRVLQAVLRYGQTWKYTNVSTIVPGFASIYRVSALEQIEINSPGLVIEDYNMTFEIHHKKLGKIAYSPDVRAASQDPLTLREYYKQIKRWNLGFWQTVRRHGLFRGAFVVSTYFFIVEMFLFNSALLLLPLVLLYLALAGFMPLEAGLDLPLVGPSLGILDIAIGLFLIDYAVTLLTALYEKKPLLMVYGLFFVIPRYIDAIVYLYTFYLVYIRTNASASTGVWNSPQRQASCF